MSIIRQAEQNQINAAKAAELDSLNRQAIVQAAVQDEILRREAAMAYARSLQNSPMNMGITNEVRGIPDNTANAYKVIQDYLSSTGTPNTPRTSAFADRYAGYGPTPEEYDAQGTMSPPAPIPNNPSRPNQANTFQ